MSKKKVKVKARRRARKHQDRAWKAAAEGNLDLARKGLRQALAECQDNPEIWNDYGVILHQSGDLEEAEKALRNAILIAPDYAEAYANLAGLVSRLGRTIQAERLQSRAVKLAPEDRTFGEQLEAYRALLPDDATVPAPAPEPRELEVEADADRILRLDRYDWTAIERDLAERGCALLEGLLAPEDCRGLIDLWDRDERFEKTVRLPPCEGTDPLRAEAGEAGAYRFFRRPLPEVVRRLRSAVYARLVPVVDDWNRRLGREQRWPASHRAFLAQCAEAGQTRTTPILLRYMAPAVNELHQDVWGRIYFPLQLAVTLSLRDGQEGFPPKGPGGAFSGGAFVLADDSTGRRARRLEIATSRGDGVIFCTRERLVRFAGGYACQAVRHGMARLTAGERYVLGVPFHDYKASV